MASQSSPKDIVIIGGGIIGATTAYFLTRHPSYNPSTHRVTLLEASTVAGGASGKAGGLLALWAYPSALVPLSYRLHAELAKKHNGEQRWGYRRIHCGQLEAQGRPKPRKKEGPNHQAKENGEAYVSLQKRDQAAIGKLRAAGLPKDLDWVASDSAQGYSEMGDPDTTAQVHPYHFTTSMAELAKEKGVNIVEHARVEFINRTDDGKAVESIGWRDSGGKEQKTQATHVVLAAGPWTSRLLKDAPISGLRAHSVTIRPSRQVSAFALFTDIELPANFDGSKKFIKAGGQNVTPEIYARPFNEVYACGEGDRLVPLPDTTAQVETDQSRCQEVVDYVGSISDELRDGEVTARQACYLPVSSKGSGGPWIGETASTKGLVLASGHTCWGIQNGPGTGKCVSEIVMDGTVKSTKLGMLDPAVSLKNV